MRDYFSSNLTFICWFFYLILLMPLTWTNAFQRPLLVISLDGMRADKFDEFVQANPSSSFKKLIDNGLKAEYMIPAFPSLTFPNHFTLVTGVYPEEHGIVGNQIYDPSAKRKVNLISDRDASDARWWNRSEPIWLTAKNKGLKTGTYCWPGSEVLARTADIYIPYANCYNFTYNIDEAINWLVKFKLDLVFLYFSQPDANGHSYGPDSPQYIEKIRDMDNLMGYLLNGLDKSKQLDHVNIIVTSDHGMTRSRAASYLVTKYVDSNLIDFDRSIFSYVSHIYPKDDSQLIELYHALHSLPNMSIYYKYDLPSRFHYSNSDRIGPIVVISNEGYSLTSDPLYKVTPGIHGFDNHLFSMRTIFTAFGPNFKKSQVMNAFESVNVYSLMCKLLKIESTRTSRPSEQLFEPFLTRL